MSKLKAIVHRRWQLLAALTALGVLVGLASSFFAAETTTTQYVAKQTLGSTSGASNTNEVAQDGLRITRPVILDQAASILDDGTTARDLARSVTALPDSESNTVEVAATADSADVAEARAQAVVDAFIADDSAEARRSIQPQIDDAARAVESATESIQGFDAASAAQMASLQPGDPTLLTLQQNRRQLELALDDAKGQLSALEATAEATASYKSLGAEPAAIDDNELVPVPSNPLIRGFIFGILGFFLGVGVVAVVERYSARVDTREELADAIDLPLLTEVGDVGNITDSEGRVHLTGLVAEPYRRVRSAIQYAKARAEREGGPPINTVLFTSTFPSEGKSTSASLTALALAEVGFETMVVSADFRKPTIETMLGTPRHPSLQSLARDGGRTLSVDDVVHPAPEEHLWVAASGESTKETTGPLQAARDVVEEAVARGGVVVIDSPPVLAANDSIELLDAADYVVLVIRSGRSTKRGINDTVTLLEQHGSTILGVVFVGAPGAASLAQYYEGYYAAGDGDTAAPSRREGPRFPVQQTGSTDADAENSDATGESAAPSSNGNANGNGNGVRAASGAPRVPASGRFSSMEPSASTRPGSNGSSSGSNDSDTKPSTRGRSKNR